jgi:hypothetical protein
MSLVRDSLADFPDTEVLLAAEDAVCISMGRRSAGHPTLRINKRHIFCGPTKHTVVSMMR